MITYVKYRFIKELILYAKGEDTIMSFLDTIDIELSNRARASKFKSLTLFLYIGHTD